MVTAGRDATARVWDMRTKAQAMLLAGHTATVADVKCQESDPQVITGSMDTTVRYGATNLFLIPSLMYFPPQIMGSCGRQNDDPVDPSQKICPNTLHPSSRVFFCLGFSWWKQYQKMEVPRGYICAQLFGT